MSSAILYRFRSGTSFEALPLPGSAARLFDVKKAIVLAKKLDQAGALDFDLSVTDAASNETYTDENMIMARGTRLVIQRLPAARGHGFLTRMQRQPYGGGPAAPAPVAPSSNFYTIDSRAMGDDDEFVSTSVPPPPPPPQEDQELAALRAATDAASQATRGTGMIRPSGQNFRSNVAGQGPPPPRSNIPGQAPPAQNRQRMNADPELREQEKQQMPKKRATGIPRTFLNLNAPPQTETGGEGEGNAVPLLQPNTQGFQDLINRGGGLGENMSGTKRNLDYALKLTATTVPEYLQCAICNNVVKDAMILPWDPEGRTTCESCIRDSLTQNGFRCPLTGQEGVSPDDLLPNHALRKAAEQFVKGVMEKMESIVKDQVDEDDDIQADDAAKGDAGLDGEGTDKGVIVSKRSIADRKKKEDEDPFGTDDVFGGDVFAVAEDKPEEEPFQEEPEKKDTKSIEAPKKGTEEIATAKEETPKESDSKTKTESSDPGSAPDAQETRANRDPRARSVSPVPNQHRSEKSPSGDVGGGGNRRERRRGPPVGYSMGPAGGGASGLREHNREFSPRADPRSNRGFENEERSGREQRGRQNSKDFGRERNHDDNYSGGRPRDYDQAYDGDHGRKRARTDSGDGSYEDQRGDRYGGRQDGGRQDRYDRGPGGQGYGGRGSGYNRDGGRGYGGR